MNLIYVASPYRGDVETNLAFAKECCNFVLEQGCNFFCPHLMYTQVLNDDIAEERELGLKLGQDMLLKCDELWCFGEVITEGMKAEIEYAKGNGIAIRQIADISKEMQSQASEPCLC